MVNKILNLSGVTAKETTLTKAKDKELHIHVFGFDLTPLWLLIKTFNPLC